MILASVHCHLSSPCLSPHLFTLTASAFPCIFIWMGSSQGIRGVAAKGIFFLKKMQVSWFYICYARATPSMHDSFSTNPSQTCRQVADGYWKPYGRIAYMDPLTQSKLCPVWSIVSIRKFGITLKVIDLSNLLEIMKLLVGKQRHISTSSFLQNRTTRSFMNCLIWGIMELLDLKDATELITTCTRHYHTLSWS